MEEGLRVVVDFLCLEFSADMVLKMNRGDGFFKEVQNKKPFRQIWVVRINDRIVPVKTEQIAYFFSEDKCNHLVTFDGGKFIVDATMDAIMEDLDPKKFFRINRGCIVSLASIDSAIVNSGRYAVEVHPSIGITMTIARSRVDEFIKWLG